MSDPRFALLSLAPRAIAAKIRLLSNQSPDGIIRPLGGFGLDAWIAGALNTTPGEVASHLPQLRALEIYDEPEPGCARFRPLPRRTRAPSPVPGGVDLRKPESVKRIERRERAELRILQGGQTPGQTPGHEGGQTPGQSTGQTPGQSGADLSASTPDQARASEPVPALTPDPLSEEKTPKSAAADLSDSPAVGQTREAPQADSTPDSRADSSSPAAAVFSSASEAREFLRQALGAAGRTSPHPDREHAFEQFLEETLDRSTWIDFVRWFQAGHKGTDWQGGWTLHDLLTPNKDRTVFATGLRKALRASQAAARARAERRSTVAPPSKVAVDHGATHETLQAWKQNQRKRG